MAPRHPVRRSVLPVVLAVLLAAASGVATSALGPGPTRPPAPADPASVAVGPTAEWFTHRAPGGPPAVASRPGMHALVRPTSAPTAAPAPKPAAKPKPTPKPSTTRATPKPSKVKPPVASVLKGRNHFWMSSLGVSRSVTWYPCGASRAPGLGVYRWGCAGANNVYLLGHAYESFKTLHDAYVSGRLRKGIRASYADADGRVRTYAVVWWRLTTPDNGAFAYAAQSQPSMTLQTCVGSRSQYRLIVRLVAVS